MNFRERRESTVNHNKVLLKSVAKNEFKATKYNTILLIACFFLLPSNNNNKSFVCHGYVFVFIFDLLTGI